MKIRNLCRLAAVALCVLPACGKKDAGCKLDSECPDGQICRNMKCEANSDAGAPAAQDSQNAEAARPAAKPTTPQQI